MGIYILLGLVVLLFLYVISTDSTSSTDLFSSQGFNISMSKDIGFIVDGLIINDDDDDNMFHDDFSL